MAEESVIKSRCCIVGAGPAGVMLAYLLARHQIPVVLLEMHQDFDRDFRGDTLHPGVLEILGQLGLAEDVLALPHTKLRTLTFHSPLGPLPVADMGRLKTRFPFVTMLPQSQFLEFIVNRTRPFRGFEFIPGARVVGLLERNGQIHGVRVRSIEGEDFRVEATLTVGTDGRFSTIRRLAELPSQPSAPGIDVLWFRIPRREDQQGGGFLGPGGYMIVLPRGNEWQVGFVVKKGTYQQHKEAGIGRFREQVCRLAPQLAASVEELSDWSQIKYLFVEANCLKKWYKDGLLLLGDAAHTMSPVGGVGINLAIQDAVEAFNLLRDPLAIGDVSPRDLKRVQKRRRRPVRLVQALQAFDQKYLIEPALDCKSDYRMPSWLRFLLKIPILRDQPSRILAFGGRRVRIAGIPSISD